LIALLLLLTALQTSYQLGDADYGAGDMEGGWVIHLVAALNSQLKWLQVRSV
jgi:hypothetical protein